MPTVGKLPWSGEFGAVAQQSAAQQRAVTQARRAADLATQRYRSGIVAYIEVIDASRDALQTERANAQLTGQRLITTIQLIKALGGGWNSEQLFTRTTHSSTDNLTRN